jgi:hypothetical protein
LNAPSGCRHRSAPRTNGRRSEGCARGGRFAIHSSVSDPHLIDLAVEELVDCAGRIDVSADPQAASLATLVGTTFVITSKLLSRLNDLVFIRVVRRHHAVKVSITRYLKRADRRLDGGTIGAAE